jgi:hypothetical protein
MKKLLVVLLAVTAIAATSCKKDNEITPNKADKTIKTFDKSNVGSWD